MEIGMVIVIVQSCVNVTRSPLNTAASKSSSVQPSTSPPARTVGADSSRTPKIPAAINGGAAMTARRTSWTNFSITLYNNLLRLGNAVGLDFLIFFVRLPGLPFLIGAQFGFRAAHATQPILFLHSSGGGGFRRWQNG